MLVTEVTVVFLVIWSLAVMLAESETKTGLVMEVTVVFLVIWSLEFVILLNRMLNNIVFCSGGSKVDLM